MTKLRQLICGLSILFFTCFAFSKSFIIKSNDLNLNSRQAQDLKQALPEGVEIKPVFPDLGIYEYVSKKKLSLEEVKEEFSSASRSLDIGESQIFANEIMTLRRATPSDSDFNKQWSLNTEFGVLPEKAWNISTGGKTALGDEIVVAVVDGGFQVDHKDLTNNLWTNKDEIAGNGIDDDGNGYVDDIHGWNAASNSGNINSNSHGTHVAGIMGADGDNSSQVVGVNWNVKVMVVSAERQLGSTSTIMKAYNYILDQKKLWIKTNGKQGANVVIINSSFGIDRANCNSDRYKAWNDMYNVLGEYGILSAAATANRGYDVDKIGDVPTGCSSPYVVSVTNSTKEGKRNSGAAWGSQTIDIAAPGTGILSLVPNNRTGNKTGTSMATPHVAGAVGLLHATASKNFAEFYKTNPAEAALELKKIMMDTVTKTAQFSREIVSGGLLNLGAAATSINSWNNDVSTPSEPSHEPTTNPSPQEEQPTENTNSSSEPAAEKLTFAFEKSLPIPDAFFSNGVLETQIKDVIAIDKIDNIKVNIQVTHPNTSELKLTLVAPNKRKITLQRKQLFSKDITFGLLNKNPLQPFGHLGAQPAGTWTLIIEDEAWLSSGQLIGWSLTLPSE